MDNVYAARDGHWCPWFTGKHQLIGTYLAGICFKLLRLSVPSIPTVVVFVATIHFVIMRVFAGY